MKSAHRIIVGAAAVIGAGALSACTTDPEFWDAVAMGLDQAAYDVANDPLNCPLIPDGAGGVMRYCAPRMATDENGVVYAPVDNHHHDRGDRRHRRDRDRDRLDRYGKR